MVASSDFDAQGEDVHGQQTATGRGPDALIPIAGEEGTVGDPGNSASRAAKMQDGESEEERQEERQRPRYTKRFTLCDEGWIVEDIGEENTRDEEGSVDDTSGSEGGQDEGIEAADRPLQDEQAPRGDSREDGDGRAVKPSEPTPPVEPEPQELPNEPTTHPESEALVIETPRKNVISPAGTEPDVGHGSTPPVEPSRNEQPPHVRSVQDGPDLDENGQPLLSEICKTLTQGPIGAEEDVECVFNSIAMNGEVFDDVMLIDEDGRRKLMDGLTRYRGHQEAIQKGKPVKSLTYKLWDAEKDGDPWAWAIAKNFAHVNRSLPRKCDIAIELRDKLRGLAGDKLAFVAKLLGISPAAAYAKLKINKTGDERLIAAANARHIPLNKGAELAGIEDLDERHSQLQQLLAQAEQEEQKPPSQKPATAPPVTELPPRDSGVTTVENPADLLAAVVASGTISEEEASRLLTLPMHELVRLIASGEKGIRTALKSLPAGAPPKSPRRKRMKDTKSPPDVPGEWEVRADLAKRLKALVGEILMFVPNLEELSIPEIVRALDRDYSDESDDDGGGDETDKEERDEE